jgi:2,5-furandicarboxylate decarboxylase 1
VTQDLRTALARLDKAGQLRVIDDLVDPRFEAAGLLWHLKHGPTVLMRNVKGYDTPIVGNLLNTRDKLATSMDWRLAEQQDRLIAAVQNPVPPITVGSSASFHTRVYDHTAHLGDSLPVPTVSEHDGGAYISAGVVTCRSPESGRRNFAIARLQVRDGRLGVYFAPTHSRRVLEECRERGIPMEVAIAVGLPPLWTAASQFLAPLDESHIAGGMLAEPAHLVSCETVDLEVPAYAEIVLEGVIDPVETEVEGPFGEFPGTYAETRQNPVVRLTRAASRPQPIFQMIVGGRHPEHLITGAVAREAGLLQALRAVIPGARAVALPEGGTSRFHAAVAITKRFEGEGRLAILTALSQQDLIKHVIVVDDDIDVNDPSDLEWALATRFRADRDLIVVPGAKSNPVDPMSEGATVAKMGIDATLPVRAPGESREQVDVPAEVRRSVAEKWGVTP